MDDRRFAQNWRKLGLFREELVFMELHLLPRLWPCYKLASFSPPNTLVGFSVSGCYLRMVVWKWKWHRTALFPHGTYLVDSSSFLCLAFIPFLFMLNWVINLQQSAGNRVLESFYRYNWDVNSAEVFHISVICIWNLYVAFDFVNIMCMEMLWLLPSVD